MKKNQKIILAVFVFVLLIVIGIVCFFAIPPQKDFDIKNIKNKQVSINYVNSTLAKENCNLKFKSGCVQNCMLYYNEKSGYDQWFELEYSNENEVAKIIVYIEEYWIEDKEINPFDHNGIIRIGKTDFYYSAVQTQQEYMYNAHATNKIFPRIVIEYQQKDGWFNLDNFLRDCIL